MTRKKWLLTLAGWTALSGQAVGQVPLPPAAAAAGVGLPGVAPGPAAPTPPKTLWGFLGLGKEQKEFCLRKLCAKPIGQLLNNGFAPISALSGGLISGFCPKTPTIADLADAGAVGAASKIQLDEAGAAKRRAAVRYLGTVDCHYWPEAEDGLIGALRGDRNECVRYEAALALGSGCCCTKKTIEALTIVVSCSDRDGAPKETSHRVHAAAQAALDHCLACMKPAEAPAPAPAPKPEGEATPEIKKEEKLPPPVVPPVVPAAAKQSDEKIELGEAKPFVPANSNAANQGVVFAAATTAKPATTRPVGFEYYAKITQVPWPALLAEARKTAANPRVVIPVGDKSLASLISQAAGETPVATPMPVRSERPTNLWDKLTGPPVSAPVMMPATAPAIVAAMPTPSLAVLAAEPVKTSEVVTTREALTEPVKPMVVEPAMVVTPPSAPQKPFEFPIVQTGKSAPQVEPVSKVVETPKPAPAKVPEPAQPEKPAAIQLPVVQNGVIVPPPVVVNDSLNLPEPLIIKSTPKVEKAPPAKKLEPASTPSAVPTIKYDFPAVPATAKPIEFPAKPAATTSAPVKAQVTEKKAEPKLPAPIVMVKPAAESKPRLPEPEAPMPLPLSYTHQMPIPNVPAVQPKVEAPKTLVAVPTEASQVAKLLADAKGGATVEERREAIRTLVKGRISTPEVMQTLEQLSNDPTPGVRADAVIGLARLRNPATNAQPARAITKPAAVVPSNMPALPSLPKGVGQPTARAAAALSRFSTGSSVAERCQVASELDIDDLKSSPGLVHMLIAGAKGGQAVEERQACIRALVRGKAAHAEVVAALDEISNDPTPAIRADAVIGVAKLRVPASR